MSAFEFLYGCQIILSPQLMNPNLFFTSPLMKYHNFFIHVLTPSFTVIFGFSSVFVCSLQSQFDSTLLLLHVYRYSMLGRVEDPANELSNGDVYMTNSKRDPLMNQNLTEQNTGNEHFHRR